jgi:hypothetical protein
VLYEEDYCEADGSLLICFDCLAREPAEQLERRWLPRQQALPPERQLEALFEAARVLLKEGISEEDRVFPTLAFANAIGEGYVDLVDGKDRLFTAQQSPQCWETEADKFIQACPRFRPVDVVDGVLILERLPVSVKIIDFMHPEIVMPKAVTLEVIPSSRMAKPQHVASLYRKVLSAAGIPCTERRRGPLNFDFTEHISGNRLLITLKHTLEDIVDVEDLASVYPEGKPTFPHPSVIQRFYETIMGKPHGHGFARYLVARSRGRGPDADTLVPACVLGGTWKTLPEEGYSSSEVNQL